MSATPFTRILHTVFVIVAGVAAGASLHATTLPIPDTMSGKSFTLSIRDTFMQIRTGNQTVTAGVNGATFWGPTLFMNKGDTVRMTVINKLNDSTTVHWHGMHLPAVMDGGPHQVIPPGTVWQPYWKITNQASTLWYHPHLHEMTQEQMTKGVGGFIIIRDEQEAALALPRTYGVDDIPLVFTSRRFMNNNQFVTANSAYGDYLFANGVMNAEATLPRQFVRLRILNAEIERAYNIGFSDNRKFWLIATDGGLIEAPLELTRLRLGVGERAEILVDMSKDAQGSSIDLKAYNAGQAFGFPGGEPATNGQFGSLLNNKDFVMLKITAGAPTANGITSLPTTLIQNTYWKASDAKMTKGVSVTGGIPGPPPGNLFTLDNKAFAFSRIDNTVTLNDTVAWTVTNNRVFSHSFHIHDVMFKIVARNGNPAAVGAWEQGWKDVAYLPTNESVTFVAKFDDYADTSHPFMYHCHFANHEDEGMMGQFIVKPPPTPANVLSVSPSSITLDAPAGSSRAVNVTSNVAWTASADRSWLNIDKASGTGNGSITVMAQENTSVTSRTGILTVVGGGITTTVSVTQSGVGPTLVLSTSTVNVPSAPKTTGTIEVRSNVQWTAASDQTWCSPDPRTGTGVTTVRLLVDTNTTGAERTAHVTFLAQNVPVQTLTVIQSPAISSVEDDAAQSEFILYPNPVTDRLQVRMSQPDAVAYYISVTAANGRTVLMLPQPDLGEGIDVSRLAAGTYFVRLTDKRTKSVSTRSFIKQ